MMLSHPSQEEVMIIHLFKSTFGPSRKVLEVFLHRFGTYINFISKYFIFLLLLP